MSGAHIVDQHGPEWYAERRTYIGASDAPVLFGISPWRSEYQLWLEKTGRAEPDGTTNAQQAWGHRVEQVAADIYAEVTGRRLRRYAAVQRHKAHPFIAANPDRGCIGERRGVQIKSTWRPMERVPDNYQLQCQQEMLVMGWDVVDLAVLTGFGGFEVHELPRDDEQIRLLLDVEPAWWQRHIVEDVEPQRTGRYVNALRGEDTMRASAGQVEWLRERRAVDEALARLKARKEGIDERVKRSMAGARRLDGPDYGVSVTWTKAWARDVDETDWPALAQAYRALLDSQVDDPAALDAIAGLHTSTVTKSGGGGLTVKWKDVEPTSEEEV